MNALYNTPAEISRALLAHVVNPSGRRPSLDITTPQRVFHLVTIEEPPLARMQGDELVFITFVGAEPIGKPHVFMWPPVGVEEPALGITEIEVYGP